jgi:hypothetical protein
MTMTTEDIRNKLKGYSPQAAKEEEAKGDHEGNLKFAPPWYELKHFRAKLHLEGIQPNEYGIEQIIFSLENLEIYEGEASTYTLAISLPKKAPGYPTDELNLTVESVQELGHKAENITDLDGLDVEMQLDYKDHPWMKEQTTDKNTKVKSQVLVGGVPIPKRCWYYRTVAVFGSEAAAATEPEAENVAKLAEYLVGKDPDECQPPNLIRHMVSLGIRDSGLQSVITDNRFPEYASQRGLIQLGEDGKYTQV